MKKTIIICEDNESEAQNAEQVLRKSTFLPEDDFRILIYLSEKKLLTDVAAGNVTAELFFMDIELDDMTGIEVAEKLNRLLPESYVVYLTNYLRYAVDVYQTKHQYFIMKSELERRLPQVWEKIQQIDHEKNDKVEIPLKNSGVLRVAKDEVLYAERRQRVTIVYLLDRQVESTLKLSELEQLWGISQFLKCHNSFLINMTQIVLYRREDVEMKNGCVVPISRKYQKKVREVFMHWSKMQLF